MLILGPRIISHLTSLPNSCCILQVLASQYLFFRKIFCKPATPILIQIPVNDLSKDPEIFFRNISEQ